MIKRLLSFSRPSPQLARRGGFPKDLGAESGRWLEERGAWPGIRWWALENDGSVHFNTIFGRDEHP